MSPIAGFVRMRKHQFGRQDAFGTRVAATRAYPFKGTPSVDLGWTDPDVDVGSIDPVAPPHHTAPDITAPLTDAALAYNNIPLIMCGFFGGNVVPTGPGGGAKTWLHEPSSDTPDAVDVFTYEFGDDVTDDWFQLSDGIIESFEVSGPEGLGPLTTSMNWRFGSAYSSGSTDYPDSPTVPTAGLDVSTTDAIVYLKDCKLYIASTYAGLAAGQVSDALHSFVLRGNQEVDQKRWANGDQSFGIDAYGRGARSIELECTFAKTDDTVGTGSESDAWMSEDAVTRFARLEFISKVLITGPSTYYKWTIDMPMRYYTRAEGEVGGNTVVVLTGHAFNEPTMGGVFTSTAVNTLSNVEFGGYTS